MKYETLEEGIERAKEEYPVWLDEEVFILGAKWQQERSYSEEEVLNIIQLFNDDFNMIQDTVPKWFEQFKKK